MKPTAWREDGWPLCPRCGQDELAILSVTDRNVTAADVPREAMFCYMCAVYTVEAGEGTMREPLEDGVARELNQHILAVLDFMEKRKLEPPQMLVLCLAAATTILKTFPQLCRWGVGNFALALKRAREIREQNKGDAPS